jgi:hypothetical protein
MADIVYTSALLDEAKGNIDYDTDTFYIMLLTSAYTPSAAHAKRSDLTASEVTGTGYTAGGQALTGVTVTASGTNVIIDATDPVWPSSTITARYGAIYKHRGGAATADELVCLKDFGGNVISTSGSFTVTLGVDGFLKKAAA